MKKRIFIFASLITISLIFPYDSKANPAECEEASQNLRDTRDDLNNALRGYANCLADSNGHEVCADEFSHLQSAQGNFKNAVSDYETDCHEETAPDEDTTHPLR